MDEVCDPYILEVPYLGVLLSKVLLSKKTRVLKKVNLDSDSSYILFDLSVSISLCKLFHPYLPCPWLLR